MHAELANAPQAQTPQGLPNGLQLGLQLGLLRSLGQLHSVDSAPHTSPAPTALLRSVLDALSLGLLLLDADTNVLHANQAAQALCKVGAPISLSGRRLGLLPDHRQQLDVALRAARRRQWSMLVLRLGTQRLSVGVVPMSGDATDAGQPGLAAMLVIAPQAQPSSLALQFFCQTHHLTAAESAVLVALCKGHKPNQIAAAGRVAISTVRTQVAAIREKTQTSSVSHLLQLVAALPPMASVCVDEAAGGRWASA